VEFDATDTAIFVGDLVKANNYGGLTGFEKATAADALKLILKSSKTGKRPDEKSEERLQRCVEIVEDISYIKEYLNAYFRQWKLFKVTMRVSELRQKIIQKIIEEIPFLEKEEIYKYADELFEKLTGKKYSELSTNGDIEVINRLETSQFVSRAGDQFGFPGVTVALDPLADQKFNVTTIDWKKVGADIVRVYFEAVGDRLMGLPADPTSTLCKLKNEFCYPLENDISTQDFYAVSELANQTEAHVSTAVGQLTRGVWWTSLNNEALASIIETSAGAVAKKCAEKFGYCVYSCAKMHGKSRDSMMSETTLKKIKIKVTY
jgi:hypothetical protein